MRLAASSLLLGRSLSERVDRRLLTKIRRNLVLIFVGGFDSLRASFLANSRQRRASGRATA